ncbi:hypothetical protein BREVNS_2146 [Brevinematales bacterium NS]|nr:hypothetical protein BREVNS_2146 [Brevinematales bacterium NS]
MGQGLRPSSPLFLFTRAYLSFLAKNRFIYCGKEYFYAIFCFLFLLLRPSHIRAKVSSRAFCLYY